MMRARMSFDTAVPAAELDLWLDTRGTLDELMDMPDQSPSPAFD